MSMVYQGKILTTLEKLWSVTSLSLPMVSRFLSMESWLKETLVVTSLLWPVNLMSAWKKSHLSVTKDFKPLLLMIPSMPPERLLVLTNMLFLLLLFSLDAPFHLVMVRWLPLWLVNIPASARLCLRLKLRMKRKEIEENARKNLGQHFSCVGRRGNY